MDPPGLVALCSLHHIPSAGILATLKLQGLAARRPSAPRGQPFVHRGLTVTFLRLENHIPQSGVLHSRAPPAGHEHNLDHELGLLFMTHQACFAKFSQGRTYHGSGYLLVMGKRNAGRIHTNSVPPPFPRKSASYSTNLPPHEGESLEAYGQS